MEILRRVLAPTPSWMKSKLDKGINTDFFENISLPTLPTEESCWLTEFLVFLSETKMLVLSCCSALTHCEVTRFHQLSPVCPIFILIENHSAVWREGTPNLKTTPPRQQAVCLHRQHIRYLSADMFYGSRAPALLLSACLPVHELRVRRRVSQQVRAFFFFLDSLFLSVTQSIKASTPTAAEPQRTAPLKQKHGDKQSYLIREPIFIVASASLAAECVRRRVAPGMFCDAGLSVTQED